MGNLYNRIEELCKSRNTNITKMCSETGISRGSLTDLKAGRSKSLSQNALHKISSYFSVSADYLLGTSTPDTQLSEFDFALLSETENLTDEQKQSVINYVKFLKSQE